MCFQISLERNPGGHSSGALDCVLRGIRSADFAIDRPIRNSVCASVEPRQLLSNLPRFELRNIVIFSERYLSFSN